MKLSLLLVFLCSQIKLITAFAVAGAYERAWFWQCYQLDANNETPKIARRCKGTALNKRCTFDEFILHINLGDKIDKSKLLKVDTSDLLKTIDALTAAKATGPYDCQHIFEGRHGPNDATGNFGRMRSWMQKNTGQLSTLTDSGKLSMRRAVTTVAKLRIEEAAVYLNEHFGDNGGILSKRVQPIWADPYNPKIVSADTVEYASRKGTIKDHPTLMTYAKYDALVDDWMTEDPGHSGNVREMRVAAQVASESCIR